MSPLPDREDIKDGTSNTILLGETRAGITSFDIRGTWAMANTASALWACGYDGDANGPNCSNLYSDDIVSCSDIVTAVGGQSQLAQLGMSCYPDPNDQQAARSMHAGGVTVGMLTSSRYRVHPAISSTIRGATATRPN